MYSVSFWGAVKFQFIQCKRCVVVKFNQQFPNWYTTTTAAAAFYIFYSKNICQISRWHSLLRCPPLFTEWLFCAWEHWRRFWLFFLSFHIKTSFNFIFVMFHRSLDFFLNNKNIIYALCSDKRTNYIKNLFKINEFCVTWEA